MSVVTITAADAARFASKIDTSVGLGRHGDCHLWTTGTFPNGYGQFWLDGRAHGAHRVAFALATGLWPPGMVLHSCDTPRCVRPEHLRVGDAGGNAADARSRGRHSHGERHGSAKLTEQDVRSIREARAAGRTVSSLARDHGVSRRTIRFIETRKTWAHV